MAYLVYKVKSGKETLSSIASTFGTTTDEICKVNNIQPPYPIYVEDLFTDVDNDENVDKDTINLPFITNGNQSFENYYKTAYDTTGIDYESPLIYEQQLLNSYSVDTPKYSYNVNTSFTDRDISPGRIGKACWISINGKSMTFPCYPQSVSDSNTANYNPVSILGRSEPFQYYVNSGPRVVSVDFQMHCEMVDTSITGLKQDNYVYNLVHFIESSCYPNYGKNAIAAPRVKLHIANNIQITGIISSVSTKYDGPILDMGSYNNSQGYISNPQYSMVNISFSVTEVTGTPFSQSQIAELGGYR